MSVQEIEEAIQKQLGPAIHDLPLSEREELREWFGNFLEDQMEMTDEFRASIDQGLKEMKEGKGRVHKKGGGY